MVCRGSKYSHPSDLHIPNPGPGFCSPTRKSSDSRYTQRMLIDEINDAGFDGAYAPWLRVRRSITGLKTG